MDAPTAWRSSLISPAEEHAWEALYRTHPLGRAIVPKWEELAGWKNHRIGLFSGAQLIGGLILSTRRIPRLPLWLSRVTCAMVGPSNAPAMLRALLAEVDRLAARRLLVETELRLKIPASDEIEGFEDHRDLFRVLLDLGYQPLEKAETTYVVRIDRDDEALLNAFERSARNKIRKAQKSGVVIATSSDTFLMEQFYEAYLAMSERKQAQLAAKKLVVDGLKPLIEGGYAQLFTESYSGRVSNMVVVDMLGMPCYSLGTRTEANVKGEVPGAAQALHYEIMRQLRDRGKKYYDLGGCEGPVPVEGHPNHGVWRFKYGFNGPFVRFFPFLRKTRGPLSGPVLEIMHRLRGDYV